MPEEPRINDLVDRLKLAYEIFKLSIYRQAADEIIRLEAEVARLRQAADAGHTLSTYAASIHWGETVPCPECRGAPLAPDYHMGDPVPRACPACDGRKTVQLTSANTPDWFDGLCERIERVQALAKRKESI